MLSVPYYNYNWELEIFGSVLAIELNEVICGFKELDSVHMKFLSHCFASSRSPDSIKWFSKAKYILLSEDNVSVSLDKWHCGNEHNSVLSQLEIRERGGSPQGHQSCLCVFTSVCFIRVCLKLVARDTLRDRCFLLLSFFQLLITLSSTPA